MFVSLLLLMAQAAPATPKLGVVDPVNCVVTPRALGCPERKNDRYRLDDDDTPAFDHKADGLRQGTPRCGLMGMPVCPSNGRPILTSRPE
ncbi:MULTISPECIES: hypothetical protein [unclassified Sphingomonas]|uniref:hypothetical protein n=1 Tax=unclassified Sphingomonas TaxID=196159 RepID=UPI0006F456E8|nr:MULTISPECIES: hypothetical protein [unclassified Sphingomonas]KQM65415.1 hypothetical protein ASE65_15280 [Sphingomonas sp. Leaf16]KQN17017.1 hypothetical protein ASE83_15260 [Sphingomonas sp. Leaf32]KQN17191.1 hypothetical protein ASE81_15325 [Sphingomonas sp. Leaf29]